MFSRISSENAAAAGRHLQLLLLPTIDRAIPVTSLLFGLVAIRVLSVSKYRHRLLLLPTPKPASSESTRCAEQNLAEAGLAVAVLPKIFCKSRRLVPVKLGRRLRSELPPAPRSALWLVGHRALRDVPRIAAVWQFIEEEARRLAE
jgi:DNA-binding transcriptional LysR family regulator